MYHSITIGDKNTWDDWHLIPTSRPLFNPPPFKAEYVEIAGGDGVLDLSTTMSGEPLCSNRTGSWSFYVENDFWNWPDLYSEIMAYLHGQKLRAVLEDDPDYCYEGRFTVNQWRSDPHRSMIEIGYNVAPNKIFIGKTVWEVLQDSKEANVLDSSGNTVECRSILI